MTTGAMNPKVDFYFSKTIKWQKELEQLRIIVLDCGLNEELKWGAPCYTLHSSLAGRQKSNIVLIHTFKEYCALLFFKGALLSDAHTILIQQTENVQSARQVRFTNVREIIKMRAVLKTYIYEAIEVEKAGLKVKLKTKTDLQFPEELKNKFSAKGGPALKAAFDRLTPGRQRGYVLYFSAPKQSSTRESRIEKYRQQILKGKGIND